MDECHQAVTLTDAKRDQSLLQRTLSGTALQGLQSSRENKRKQAGDLAQTTTNSMAIAYMNTRSREAIHDGAVLGFKVDYRNTIISDLLEEEIPDQAYEDKEHMLEVLDAILNKSQQQLNIPKGVGKSYEAILTVKSIPRAQAYYNLLKSILAGRSGSRFPSGLNAICQIFQSLPSPTRCLKMRKSPSATKTT